jgi:hypothetical protein
LKAVIVRQRCGEHITEATNKHSIIKEFFEAVFSSDPCRGCITMTKWTWLGVWKTPRAVRQLNMAMSPVRLETKNTVLARTSRNLTASSQSAESVPSRGVTRSSQTLSLKRRPHFKIEV